MKRFFTLSSVFLVFFFVLFNKIKLTSNPQQPPAGYANDPDPSGALTCANNGCHSGNPVADSTKFSVKMCPVSAGTGALTNVVSGELKMNMRSMSIESGDGLFEGTIMVFVNHKEELDDLCNRLEQLHGINKVVRLDMKER